MKKGAWLLVGGAAILLVCGSMVVKGLFTFISENPIPVMGLFGLYVAGSVFTSVMNSRYENSQRQILPPAPDLINQRINQNQNLERNNYVQAYNAQAAFRRADNINQPNNRGGNTLPGFNDRDLELAIQQSLQNSNVRPNIFLPAPSAPMNNRDVSMYSKHTQAYIKSLTNKETIEMKIQLLKEGLSKNNDELTAEEEHLLNEFIDPITFNYIKIPVMLNERYYDLEVIAKMKEDPFSKESFNLVEIQSGRLLIEKFDNLVLRIKENHCKEETASASAGGLRFN